MAYKNQKKNKKHIQELKKDPTEWRFKNKLERERKRIEQRNEFLKEIRKKFGLN